MTNEEHLDKHTVRDPFDAVMNMDISSYRVIIAAPVRHQIDVEIWDTVSFDMGVATLSFLKNSLDKVDAAKA